MVYEAAEHFIVFHSAGSECLGVYCFGQSSHRVILVTAGRFVAAPRLESTSIEI